MADGEQQRAAATIDRLEMKLDRSGISPVALPFPIWDKTNTWYFPSVRPEHGVNRWGMLRRAECMGLSIKTIMEPNSWLTQIHNRALVNGEPVFCLEGDILSGLTQRAEDQEHLYYLMTKGKKHCPRVSEDALVKIG
jgi:hypothetical protein